MKCLRSWLVLVLVFVLVSNIYAKTIYILSFNDFHAMIYHNKTYREVPGMVFFMNAILSEIKKHGKDNVVLVSGGDNYQGTVASYDTKGVPVSDMFRNLGVVFSAVGNRDFDWGQGYFDTWQKDGNFSYLAANIIDKNTEKNPSWCVPYKMIKVSGIKIAFIGLSTLETELKVDPNDFKGLKMIDPWVPAQYWIDYLKAGKDENGTPDVIVALTHIPSTQDKITGKIIGEEINNLCLKTKGFDVIISGHRHETVCSRINGVLVVQAECHGKKYGVIEIDVDDKTKKINKIEAKVNSVPTSEVKILPENVGEKILAKYSDIEKKYSEVIGKASTDFPYDKMTINALGIYIAKLMAESTNSQLAFINGLGIQGGLEKGDVRLRDILRILPFDDTLVTMKLSGKTIKAVIEHDTYGEIKIGCVQLYGMKVVFDNSKRPGRKVISMALKDGQKIEMDKYYPVCINRFMLSGGDGYKFDGAIDVEVHNNLLAHIILIEHIKKRKILTLPDPDCFTDICGQ